MSIRFASRVLPFFLMANSLAEIAHHRVDHLPGYPGELPSRHWSGYIPVDVPHQPGVTAHVHYWLVENQAKDPQAPTVVWMQGGPGGSSLIGMFTENGPFSVNDASFRDPVVEDDGTEVLRVFDNPFSWHQEANMLYVEHPPPTGFSFCSSTDDPDTVAQCKWDDSNQADVSLLFIAAFFGHYPELQSNRFMMTGESYAGVLVPMLALKILDARTDANQHVAPYNLEGFCLGNAVPGNRVYTATPYSGWMGVKVAVDFRYGHGMISETTYNKLLQVCDGYWETYDPPASKECRDLLENPIRPVMSETGDTDLMGGGYFIYDTCEPDLLVVKQGMMDMTRSVDDVLVEGFRVQAAAVARSQTEGHGDEPQATNHRLGGPTVQTDGRGFVRDADPQARTTRHPSTPRSGAPPEPNSGQYMCGQERGALVYLNSPAVQRALHVRDTKFSFVTRLEYSYTKHSLLEDYKSTLVKNLRIVQYSGDADPCVPFVGTQRWIEGLDLEVASPWKPWRGAGTSQVSGYRKTYNGGRMAFVTIRDAGHMVPRYKPKEALHMFRTFVRDEEW